MKKILLLFIAVILTANVFYAQTKRQSAKEYNKAKEYLADERYNQAKPIFNKFLQTDSSNIEYNFYMGICELYTDEPNEAIVSFDKVIDAYKKTNEEEQFTKSSYFYKAKAYHNLYLFDEEVAVLNELSSFELDETEKKELETTINNSKIAQDIFFNFQPIIVTRLDILNSEYDDHTPIPTATGKVLYFTSKRPGGLSDKSLSDEGKYFEDIWIWKEDEEPKNAGRPINTLKHDATGGLSLDGKTIFIYRATERKLGDIYISTLQNGNWTDPVKLGKNINKKKSIERHAALSPDGKKLYFSSDRKDGRGGRDIWVSELQEDNSWGVPQNLNINTEKDEESPYMLSDGITFYFSSKGYKNLGGYDIFKCMLKEDGSFSEPENIGFPINTVEDDVFFFPLSDEATAYFTRRKSDNAEIFKTIFPDNTIVVESNVIGTDSLKSNKVLNACNIEVIPINGDTETDEYTLNIGKGNYKTVIVPDKDFKFLYENDGYVFDTEDIPLSEILGKDNIKKSPVLEKIEIGHTLKSKNVTYNSNSIEIIDYTKEEYNIIVKNLKKYPELVVNLSTENYKSETDSLSEKRKTDAVGFLKDAGIQEDRIYLDLSSHNIPDNTIEYTVYDTLSVKYALKAKEDALYVPETEDDSVFYIIEFENFYFSFNGSALNNVPFEKLDTLADYLLKNPQAKVGVVGYTDAVGSAAYNEKLSVKRANMVKSYLVKKGVKKEQLEVFGYGEDNPYTLNMVNGKYHEPSKKYNRRVEFFVIEQGKPKLKTVLFKDIPENYFNKEYQKDYKR